jgi:hypothetical protein
MDAEHQAIYKTQLVTILRGLTTSQGDPKQRALFGSVAGRIVLESKAPDWVTFKRQVGPKGYDSVLAALERGVADMKRQGRPLGVRAMEAVGAALIGRHNSDPDLTAAIDQLDQYIDECVTVFRRINGRGEAAGAAQQ